MEENQMEKSTEFAEFICDHICKYAAFHSQELLDNCCDDCPMGEYICDILNTYNRLNDFEKSQSYKLLQKIAELEAKCQLETKNSD